MCGVTRCARARQAHVTVRCHSGQPALRFDPIPPVAVAQQFLKPGQRSAAFHRVPDSDRVNSLGARPFGECSDFRGELLAAPSQNFRDNEFRCVGIKGASGLGAEYVAMPVQSRSTPGRKRGCTGFETALFRSSPEPTRAPRDDWAYTACGGHAHSSPRKRWKRILPKCPKCTRPEQQPANSVPLLGLFLLSIPQ